MSRILLNKDGTMDTVTLILQTKAFETLNTIRGAKELTYKENYNAANETSFTIDKFIDGNKNLSWDIVTNFKVLYIQNRRNDLKYVYLKQKKILL